MVRDGVNARGSGVGTDQARGGHGPAIGRQDRQSVRDRLSTAKAVGNAAVDTGVGRFPTRSGEGRAGSARNGDPVAIPVEREVPKDGEDKEAGQDASPAQTAHDDVGSHPLDDNTAAKPRQRVNIPHQSCKPWPAEPPC